MSIELVLWDDPEGGYGEGGGRRVQGREHMYTCGRFIGFVVHTRCPDLKHPQVNSVHLLILDFYFVSLEGSVDHRNIIIKEAQWGFLFFHFEKNLHCEYEIYICLLLF